MTTYKGVEINTIPTDAMASEADRGLKWRDEFGRGGTEVGVARARDIINKRELSAETIRRMISYFARHEVDKEAEGFRQGEQGYPSAGRIAWALWGGDAGKTWAESKGKTMDRIDSENRAAPDSLAVGDFVSWNSSGGRARGRIVRIVKDGVINIPNSDFKVEGSAEDPAALIRLYREGDEGWEITDTLVGHKFSTLTKIEDLRSYSVESRPYPNEHAARLKDPSQYDSFARKNNEGGDGIDFIYGIKDGVSEIQAIRFDKNKYSVDDAKKWLSEHDFSPIEFEEASERMEEKRHIQSVMETEDSVIIAFAKEKMEDEHKEPPEGSTEDEAEDLTEGYVEARKTQDLTTRADDMMAEAIDDRRVRMAISSETPVERSFGAEILDHSQESIDLSFLNSGRAPLLLDHDPEKQIGVIESVDLDGSARRLRAVVRFGKGELANEVYGDVTDGIRGNVSIGYRVGRMEKADSNSYRVKSWMPMEVSVVSIPADVTVGVGRSATSSQNQSLNQSISVKENKMDQNLEAVKDAAREEAAKSFQRNASEILALAARHNQRDLANKAISEGMSIEQFRGALLEKLSDKPIETTDIGMNQKEVRQYSLMNAIRGAATGRLSGFEAEVSQELARKYGKEARGFYVPTDIFKRDITKTLPSGAAGSNLVATDLLGGDFIDALRAKLVISSLGARMMSGLKGNVAIPALNAKTSVGFVAENAAPASEGAPSFRQVTMSPKSLVQYVDIGRTLMYQSDPSVEAVIRDDMMRQFAAKIDEVAIEGGGTSEPTGILGTSGIGSVAGGTNGAQITYANLVALEREVAIDNALAGNLAFLTNPKVIAKMRSTARQSSGVEGNFILNDSNNLLGYRVESTTLVPSDLTKGTASGVCSAVIFGNFSELMIGMFGGLDILVDPYTGSATGATRIAMYQDVDVAVRHAESFAAIKDVLTT